MSNKSEEYKERTKTIYEEDNADSITAKILSNCKKEYDVCIDKYGLSSVMNAPKIKKIYETFKNNSVKIRIVIEINSDNIRYSLKIIEAFDAEIRHLENIKGTFGIMDEKLYLSCTIVSASISEIPA